MHSEIISQYSLWWLVPIALAAGALTWFLYHKDEKLVDLTKGKLYLLAALRFLSLFFIAIFLLSVIFKYLRVQIEKPVIFYVQDNSASLNEAFKDDFTKKQYIRNVNTLFSELSDGYEWKKLSFGEQLHDSLRYDFSDKETDFSLMLDEIRQKYSTYNIAALIIASDGLYNRGVDPVYAVSSLNYPVYTMALGDSAQKKDVYIKDVFSNPITFAGDQFPMEIQLVANGFSGKSTSLQVYRSDKLLIDKPFSINSDDFFLKTTLYFDAEGKGLQNYKIQIKALQGEYTKANNVKHIAIDIINDKKKVLILAGAPHPDVAALRRALQTNKNIVTDFYTLDRFKKRLEDYQLVIFYQLPSNKFEIKSRLLKLKNAKIPVLFVLGTQTNIPMFNNLNTGLKISKNRNLTDYVFASFNKQFNLFETDAVKQINFNDYPPLIAPFGDYNLDSPANVLLYQQIKGVKTEKPLVFIYSGKQNGIVRAGFICGENIWRWRMQDYREHGNHEHFDAMINRIVHYLSLDVKKERFIVRAKRIFKENEAVVLRADYYNKSYELNNIPELKLKISDEKQNRFDYVFSRSGNSYILDAGQLPVGKYTFSAVLTDGVEKFVKNGAFVVMPVNVEQLNTRADYALMYRVASETGGKMFTADSLSQLVSDIKSNPNIKPVSYTTKDLMDLIEIKWLLFVIVSFLSAEWFLRKFWGSY